MKPPYIIIATLLLAVISNNAAADARFRHLNTIDGLSGERVLDVIQDKNGYMWMATDNGLDRYDGFLFTAFKHSTDDPNSLSADFVKALYEDPSGHIWIGTYGGGLDLYDPDTGEFKHYRHNDGDPHTLASDKVWSLAPGPNGTILIGTFDAGLDELDPIKGEIRHFSTGNTPGLSDNRINSIFIDSRSEVWLGTESGLDQFDPLHGSVRAYLSTAGNIKSTNIIWDIAEDKRHILWLATESGVQFLYPGTTTPTSSAPIDGIPRDLDKANLRNIFIDSKSNAWIGSIYNGLYLFDAETKKFSAFRQEPGNSDSLSSNGIWSTYQDRSGLIWIASDSGVDVLDTTVFNIRYIRPLSIDGKQRSASDKVLSTLYYRNSLLIGSTAGIYSINTSKNGQGTPASVFFHIDTAHYGAVTAMCARDKGDGLYIGTSLGYLFQLASDGHVIRTRKIGKNEGLQVHTITKIIEGDGNFVYLSTFGSGLLSFDLGNSSTRPIGTNRGGGLSRNDVVEDIIVTRPGQLWAATYRGLFQADLQTDTSYPVKLKKTGPQPYIQSFILDQQSNLLVATYDGLWKVALDKDGTPTAISVFQSIQESYNTPILALEHDEHGNIWFAVNNSIIRFNPSDGTTMEIGRHQGLPSMEYYSYSHAKTGDGWLWFGGASGIIGFDPEHIHPNLKPPDVAISQVAVYKKDKVTRIKPRARSQLTFGYQDSIVTFDLAAMDFAAPQANTYSYRLLGMQSGWTPPSTVRQITFTDMNPGRYRLEVRAANNWGTWSTTPASLDLIVLPPWWRTWWAYTLYLLLVISSSLTYVYNLKRKIKREKEISASLREANAIKTHFVEELEKQVNKATLDLRETLQGVNLKNAELEIAQKRAAEGEQIKSQFLANMSHELRTPLTGVLGYTKLLGSTNLSSEQKDYVGTIRQSSESLLAIINDTLDLSRLEAGKLLIDEVDFDLLEVIESTLELLAPIAYQKRLELVRVVPSDIPLQLRGDPLRLRQILTNLLSNAIKFTESGSVCLKVAELGRDERSVTLSLAVLDTGIGIPRNELDKLFHAYARSRISTQHHVEGTGLGLAICKKLVDLMDGEIKVDSRLGQGSSFEFRLKFKTQKHMEPRVSLPERPRILLYDSHPQSNDAWRACLERLGAEVKVIGDLTEAGSVQAEAAVMALTERELSQLQELKQKFSPTLPPMLILAPRIERQSLKDLSETLFHRVLSKTAREKTVYLELQSLVQRAVRAQPEATAVPETAKVSPPAEAPLILVADDNRINRRLLVTMLRQAGFRAAEAGNGYELLDLAKREPWHAVLMDIHMPGMDGIEAAGKLHAAMGDKVPPIIAMSADVMPETRRQVLGGLMNDFLVKPFTEQELVDMLHRHLERHARGRLTPAI